jgi:hypothetical protein
MSTSPNRADAPEMKVSCEICENEIPLSEALISEAEDYFLYFCDAECFEHWRRKVERKYDENKSKP